MVGESEGCRGKATGHSSRSRSRSWAAVEAVHLMFPPLHRKEDAFDVDLCRNIFQGGFLGWQLEIHGFCMALYGLVMFCAEAKFLRYSLFSVQGV